VVTFQQKVSNPFEKFNFVNDYNLNLRPIPVWNFCWPASRKQYVFEVNISFTHSGNIF